MKVTLECEWEHRDNWLWALVEKKTGVWLGEVRDTKKDGISWLIRRIGKFPAAHIKEAKAAVEKALGVEK